MAMSDALPIDIEACHALIRQHMALLQQYAGTTESLARDNEKLKFELEQLKRCIYGRRSERHVEDDSQLSLFEEEQAAASEGPAAAAEVIVGRSPAPGDRRTVNEKAEPQPL